MNLFLARRRRVGGAGRRPRRRDLKKLLAAAAIPSSKRLRVFMAGKLTALEAPGGGEVQFMALARQLRARGIDARPWRPWEDRLADCDLLHLIGSHREHLPLVAAAHRQGKPVVCSPIAWFDLGSRWRQPQSLARRATACATLLARAASPKVPSWRRSLYQAVDLLLPNSQSEAEQLARFFAVPWGRLVPVPNGADERFALGDAESFARWADCREYVLYAGRIEPRKNQLGFLRATSESSLPVVVLGDPVPGHERYAERCRRAAGNNVNFLPALAHHDARLAGAYAGAACLALVSWYETPGLVALEAAMSGVPLVLTEVGSAREYFGPLATYVPPDDRAAIRRAVEAACTQPRSTALADWVRARYTWQAAAAATQKAYEKIV